jgi:NADP-dependent 3-hydroxy acid dehydrogenase YdfG
LKEETVVITGASAGLGRATAREFGKHGARVALLARGTQGLEGARKEIEQFGSKAIVIPVDVADCNQHTARQNTLSQDSPILCDVN